MYLEPVPGSVTVVKHRFDCWQSTDFVRELQDREIDGLIICGVELVCCVLYAILGLTNGAITTLCPRIWSRVETRATKPTTKRSGTTCGTTSPSG